MRYRVEDRGHTTPCWVWTGAKQSAGYGALRVDGRVVLAHRHAYEQAVGPIPAGLQLDHLCRVTDCVNPEHLEPVTNRENVLRGRKAKLTADAADAIRLGAALGATKRALSAQFGVTTVQIGRIVRRQQWA